MKKHIATYPMYRTNPLIGAVMTGSRNRIGTGYLYNAEQIVSEEKRLAQYGHPMHIRWRNDECRAAYYAALAAQEQANG